MTEEVTQVEKPEDRITIQVNGQDQEIFMSGGLVRALVPFYMDTQTGTEMFGEAILQNEVIVEAVRPRTKSGQTRKLYTMDDFEISQEDASKLVAWVTEHVLYFFIDSMTTVMKFGQKNEAGLQRLMKLMQSPTGSQNSQGQNASVGPSA